MSEGKVPSFVAPFFWSDDVTSLDLERDKAHIIKQVLDYGSAQATDWLRSAYPTTEIRSVIENTPRSSWGKKSLALWSLYYGVSPKRATRFAND
jgi:hypothetical protein